MAEPISVLYITYTGFMEPLGQSQILQYLLPLSRRHKISLLSWEKSEDLDDAPRVLALRRRLKDHGIKWAALRYHKRPTLPATAYDVTAGFFAGAWLVLRRRVRVVHARSYVASLVALPLKWIFRLRFLFDMRGFWAEEMVDSGNWNAGTPLFALAKWWEKRFLLGADVVVTLTRAAVDILKEFPYLKNRAVHYETVATCVNTELFHPINHGAPRQAGAPLTLGFVGNVGMWYRLDDMIDCFKILDELRPGSRLVILNRGAHDYIRERLREVGVAEQKVELKLVPYEQVPSEMARLDAGAFFLHPYPSKRGCAPTKLGEFLACGVPCLVNAGVGEYDELLAREEAGVVIPDLSPAAKREGVRRLIAAAESPETRRRCVELARREFSLESGVALYDRLYEELGR